MEIGDSRVSFRHEIKKTLVREELIIVLLDVPVGERDNSNVIGVDRSGDKLWEIEPVVENRERDSPFMNIVERGDGEIWALNWRGDEYCLDPKTGEVLKKEFRRF